MSPFLAWSLFSPCQKISLIWGLVQPFRNIGHDFGHISFLKSYEILLVQNLDHVLVKKHSLGMFFDWETSIYFCPLFALLETPLIALTNSALAEQTEADSEQSECDECEVDHHQPEEGSTGDCFAWGHSNSNCTAPIWWRTATDVTGGHRLTRNYIHKLFWHLRACLRFLPGAPTKSIWPDHNKRTKPNMY